MDFGWFITVPGMLITGGVLLLLIALIIFISTTGKKKKDKTDANATSEAGAQSMVDGVFSQVIDNNPPAAPNAAPADPAAVAPNGEMPQVAFATPEAVPGNDMPQVAFATPETPAMPEVAPVAAPEAPAMPEVAPVAAPEAPAIYGGANPAVAPAAVVDSTPHQIYGGADPLENTQSISVTDVAAVSQPAMPEVAPVVAPAAPVMPEVAPAAPVAPVVEPINPNNV